MNTLTTSTRKRGTLLLLLMAFLLKLSPVCAQVIAFVDDDITLVQKQTNTAAAAPVHYAGKANSTPYTQYPKLATTGSMPMLGTYDLAGPNSSSLTLTGATVNPVAVIGTVDPTGVRAKYRVYLSGANTTPTSPAFNPIVLSAPAAGTSIYSVTTSQDLLAGLVNGGTYIL